jgi:hypothetical protein
VFSCQAIAKSKVFEYAGVGTAVLAGVEYTVLEGGIEVVGAPDVLEVIKDVEDEELLVIIVVVGEHPIVLEVLVVTQLMVWPELVVGKHSTQ